MLLKTAMPFNFSSPKYLSHHRTRKNRVSPVSRASPAHMNSPLTPATYACNVRTTCVLISGCKRMGVHPQLTESAKRLTPNIVIKPKSSTVKYVQAIHFFKGLKCCTQALYTINQTLSLTGNILIPKYLNRNANAVSEACGKRDA